MSTDYNQLQAMLDSLNQRLAPPAPSAPALYPQNTPPAQPQITAEAIQAAIQTAVSTEVKKYIDAHQMQQQQALAKSQPNLQEAMMKEFLLKLRASFGAGLTNDQQVWLSSNILALNGYLLTPDGKSLIQDLMVRFKNYVDQNPTQ